MNLLRKQGDENLEGLVGSNLKTKYVLVTAAYNEQDYIEKTLQSVINQSILPLKWVIVSDRSTDNTDVIIKKIAKKYTFIKYLRKDTGSERNTASKVEAINLGIGYLKHKQLDHDFFGNLDADISFDPDYFSQLLNIYNTNEFLGIIGGKIYQFYEDKLIENKTSEESVAGAVQFFRRECFEKIGGYMPLKRGFEDSLAELSARYYGWQTQSIKKLVVIHYRELGTSGKSIWQARFGNGFNEYIFGYTLSYHLLRLCYHINKKPAFIGSIAELFGYLYAFITQQEKKVPEYLVEFQKNEQKNRIKKRLKNIFIIRS